MASFKPQFVELVDPESDRIHNAVKMRIAEERFPVVSYKQGIRTTQQSEVEKAKTVLVRPQQVGFVAADSSLCGGASQQRTAWVWVAIIHFDRQVSLDSFERRMMREQIVIPRDSELEQQITISLLDAAYQHPPEKESSHGTRVTYRFQADMSRF